MLQIQRHKQRALDDRNFYRAFFAAEAKKVSKHFLLSLFVHVRGQSLNILPVQVKGRKSVVSEWAAELISKCVVCQWG